MIPLITEQEIIEEKLKQIADIKYYDENWKYHIARIAKERMVQYGSNYKYVEFYTLIGRHLTPKDYPYQIKTNTQIHSTIIPEEIRKKNSFLDRFYKYRVEEQEIETKVFKDIRSLIKFCQKQKNFYYFGNVNYRRLEFASRGFASIGINETIFSFNDFTNNINMLDFTKRIQRKMYPHICFKSINSTTIDFAYLSQYILRLEHGKPSQIV